LCVESAVGAALVDQRVADAWADHPHRFVVECADDFMVKARNAMELLISAQPSCCRTRR
jgi:hypothetical protein